MNRLMLAALAAIVLAGCGGDRSGVDIRLDSAGSKIERAGKEVGAKLDTAFHDIKTGVDEAQIEGALHRMRGMENVEVDLQDSTARLHGWVTTQEDRALVGELLGRVKGIARVTNELTVGARDTTLHDTAARRPSPGK